MNDFQWGEMVLPFDGKTFDKKKDGTRLTQQLYRIRHVMADAKWRTLREIELLTGFPQASISARLRDLRKDKFGGHAVERKRQSPGTYAYRLLLAGAYGQVGLGL